MTILDADVPYNCPTCGRPPADDRIRCYEVNLTSWIKAPSFVMVALWEKYVLLHHGGESLALTKEQAHALAERLYRYAEELP
jgi:hypothetical protein